MSVCVLMTKSVEKSCVSFPLPVVSIMNFFSGTVVQNVAPKIPVTRD